MTKLYNMFDALYYQPVISNNNDCLKISYVCLLKF